MFTRSSAKLRVRHVSRVRMQGYIAHIAQYSTYPVFTLASRSPVICADVGEALSDEVQAVKLVIGKPG